MKSMLILAKDATYLTTEKKYQVLLNFRRSKTFYRLPLLAVFWIKPCNTTIHYH